MEARQRKQERRKFFNEQRKKQRRENPSWQCHVDPVVEEPSVMEPEPTVAKLNEEQKEELIKEVAHQLSMDNFEQKICGVCGVLMLKKPKILYKQACEVLRVEAYGSDWPCKEQLPFIVWPRTQEKYYLHRIEQSAEGIPFLMACNDCYESVANDETYPRLSIPNLIFPEKISDCIKNLTIIERQMVAKTIPRSTKGSQHCFLTGHFTGFDNVIGQPVTLLPRPVDSALNHIKVIFPSPNFLLKNKVNKIFEGDMTRVKDALVWLKQNHKEYHDIELNFAALNEVFDPSVLYGIVAQAIEANVPPLTVQEQFSSSESGFHQIEATGFLEIPHLTDNSSFPLV